MCVCEGLDSLCVCECEREIAKKFRENAQDSTKTDLDENSEHICLIFFGKIFRSEGARPLDPLQTKRRKMKISHPECWISI